MKVLVWLSAFLFAGLLAFSILAADRFAEYVAGQLPLQ